MCHFERQSLPQLNHSIKMIVERRARNPRTLRYGFDICQKPIFIAKNFKCRCDYLGSSLHTTSSSGFNPARVIFITL